MEATISKENLWSLIMTLSPENKRWIADKLSSYSDSATELQPYTIEELHKRIRNSEENIRNGNTISHEEMMNFIDDYIDDFERKQQKISAYAS